MNGLGTRGMNGNPSGHPTDGRESQRHDGRGNQREGDETSPLWRGEGGWQAALDAQRLQVASRTLPILIGLSALMGLAFIALYFVLGRPWQWIGMIVELVWALALFVAAYVVAREGRLTPTVYLTTLGIIPAVIIGPALIEGIIVAGIMAGVIVIIFARLLGGRTQNRVVAGITGVATGVAVLLSGFRVFEVLSIPSWIYTSINIFVAGAVILVIAQILDSRDARYENSLAQAEAYATELDRQRATLEQRSDDLARRARYQEATATIARDAAQVLDAQTLLSRVVMLVSEQLGFYHAGVFLLDPAGEWAILQAASSAGGQQMLARGHRLRVGHTPMGIVGYVASRNKSRIALDVGKDAVFFDNPDLPDTHSEIALPLRARGEVIGALDVQSTESAAFSEEDVAVLQTLADQVAVAISNARLFQQAQESLEAERRAYGELGRKAWQELLHSRPDLAASQRYDPQGILPADGHWREEMKQAWQQGEPILGQGRTSSTLAIPLQVRGQIVGVLDAHKPADAGAWTKEEMTLLRTLVDQLSVAMESARLYEDTQRRAARDHLLGEVSSRIRETLDTDTVLQTAVREMREALGVAEVEVYLAAEDSGTAAAEGSGTLETI